MPYEGALLSATLLQAIAAIPGAVRDIRELLAGRNPNAGAALRKLDDLRQYLIAFNDTNHWLEEAKVFHERLQDLDTALEPIRTEYLQAVADGRFNFQKYSLAKVRETWQVSKIHSFDKLLSSAQNIRRIEKEPLVFNIGTYAFVSGPGWTRRLLELYSQIEETFARYDQKGEPQAVFDVSNFFNELIRTVKNHMHLLDERVRMEAVEFSRELVHLSGVLENV